MRSWPKLKPELGHIADLYSKEKLSVRQIAKLVGKSHQAVAEILRARNVEMRPCPAKGRRPKDQVMFYRGKRYTWCTKGYWRCTEMNDRHNLARRIWEENFGQIPHGWEVFYKDGDRFNIDASNLGCLSRSERQKQRMQDPHYRMMISAYGCYARLCKTISDANNPSRPRERMLKAWDTRRSRGCVSESARKAHETRRKLYGASGFKDRDLVVKKLSEAHKGKRRIR